MLKQHSREVEPRDGSERQMTQQRAPEVGLRIAWSIPDAVAASGLSRSFLYRAMTRGQLAFVKKGRRRLIPAAALSNYVLQTDVSSEADNHPAQGDGRARPGRMGA